MPKFSVNIEDLENSLTKRAYKLSEVQDRIEKVAFDLVKFKDGSFEELWKIENGDDGAYIVALYKDEDDVKIASSGSAPWNIIVKNADLNVFYKGDFICKVASASLGLEGQDLDLARKYLPAKLSSNKALRTALLDQTVSKKTILAKYPELA